MATTNLESGGYEFGVKDLESGRTVLYPNYQMAVDGYQSLKQNGRQAELEFRAIYTTPWTKANAPDV